VKTTPTIAKKPASAPASAARQVPPPPKEPVAAPQVEYEGDAPEKLEQVAVFYELFNRLCLTAGILGRKRELALGKLKAALQAMPRASNAVSTYERSIRENMTLKDLLKGRRNEEPYVSKNLDYILDFLYDICEVPESKRTVPRNVRKLLEEDAPAAAVIAPAQVAPDDAQHPQKVEHIGVWAASLADIKKELNKDNNVDLTDEELEALIALLRKDYGVSEKKAGQYKRSPHRYTRTGDYYEANKDLIKIILEKANIINIVKEVDEAAEEAPGGIPGWDGAGKDDGDETEEDN
jgi:hypothetical protein